ncbi:hypothetical protein JCM30566_16900 [Marinitoga arctica]
MKKTLYFLVFLLIIISFVSCTLKENKKPVIELIEPTQTLIDKDFNLKFKISDDVYLKKWEISINNKDISSLKFDRVAENEIEVSSLSPYEIGNTPDGETLSILILAEDNVGNTSSLKKTLKVGRKPIIKLLPDENIYDTVEGTFNIQAYIKDIDIEGYEDIADYTLNISHNNNLLYLYPTDMSIKNGTHDTDATLITSEFKSYDFNIGDYLDLYISVTDRASNTSVFEKTIKIGGLAPNISILEPNKYSSASTNLTLITEITDDVEIKDIKLYVNDIDKTAESDIYIDSLESAKLTIDAFKSYSYVKDVYLKNDRIELPTNGATIVIKAQDRAGNFVSRGFIVTYDTNSPNKSLKIIKAW